MPSNTVEDEYDDDYHSQTSDQSSNPSAVAMIQETEKLEEEAERMKGLGNKYMANKQYKKAYNSYSAALQLSPVGPNSHIFYCNRSASLLSLKNYPQAATDAKRSIALADDFSKAYARLGQALYFMKNYSEAAEAYETANKLDPDNHVTRQYLSKVHKKLERHKNHVAFDLSTEDPDYNDDSKQEKNNEQILSIPKNMSEEENSLPTTDNHTNAQSLISENVTYHADTIAEEYNEAESSSSNKKPEEQAVHYDEEVYDEDEDEEEEEDPDEIEAKKLLQSGSHLLEIKEFRYAIDAFSAALFLCPNHPLLTFQICVGRANAHNHTKRHEAAANDARLAIGVRPDISHGYSLLGRSLYYCKDYAGAIIALEESLRLSQPNDEPDIYDKAYLRKAQDALAALATDDDATIATAATNYTSMTLKSTYTTVTKSIPKLKPPRFVPREQIVAKGSNLPPMPSKWPTQSVSSSTFKLGKEREVYFGQGPLGIKLNRGCDGFVRILSTFVSKDNQIGYNKNRTGNIYPGDIVREVAGVDLRRPITNIMWGDTVALIKMAPRPIQFIVAKELSTPPTQVLDELGKAAAEEMHLMLLDGVNKTDLNKLIVPSPVCGDEPVQEFVEHTDKILAGIESSPQSVNNDQNTVLNDENNESFEEQVHPLSVDNENLLDAASLSEDQNKDENTNVCKDETVIANEIGGENPHLESDHQNEVPVQESSIEEEKIVIESKTEQKIHSNDGNQLGGEILFDVNNVSCSLPIIPWNATNNTRKLIMHGHVFILKKNRFFGEKLMPRLLTLFRNPSVLLALRRPENVGEVKKLLDLPRKTKLEGLSGKTILDSYYVAESVIDLALCKLRLSTLTTETSVDTSDNGIMNLNARQKALRANCFEIITPTESHWISLVSEDEAIGNIENLIIETSCWETALTYDLHTLHQSSSNDNNIDQGWKHEIVLGTLHSHVVLGDMKSLTMALRIIKENDNDEVIQTQNGSILERRKRSMNININMIDDHGWTALHHACYRRTNAAVRLLVNAGADCTIQTPIQEKSPCHLSAEVLDAKSLSLLLSATSKRPDPNALDASGNTPMYVSALFGKSVGQLRDPTALKKCLSALEAWGGKLILPEKEETEKLTRIHPVAVLASKVHAEELSAVLSNIQYMFPLTKPDNGGQYASLEIKFDFPIHMSLIALRKYVLMLGMEKTKNSRNDDFFLCDFKQKTEEVEIVRTIKVLLDHGFEPNQRCFFLEKNIVEAYEINAMHGFTPLQILALTADEAQEIFMKTLQECGTYNSDSNEIVGLNEANHVIEEIECIKKCILQITELLINNGARFNISASHLVSKTHVDASFSENTDNDILESSSEATQAIFSSFKKSSLEFDGNLTTLSNLIGSDKIDNLKTQWHSNKKVNGVGKIMLHQKGDLKTTHEIAVGNEMNPGCYICWKTFGRVMNRKHTCRVTGRIVCDDCSSRRIVEGGEEFRISDGQFNLAKLEDERERIRTQHVEAERRQDRKARIRNMQSARYRQKISGTEDRTERKESFGGDIGKDLFRLVTGEKVNDKREQKESSVSQLEGLTLSMGETRDKLNERGEKLHNLSDKTAALAESSREFSQLAKELRQNQSKGFFSLFD